MQGINDALVVVNRFKSFRGVAEKIATMAVNILYRDFKVPIDDSRGIDISPDVRVMRVFYRLGLIKGQLTRKKPSLTATSILCYLYWWTDNGL